MDIQKGIKNYDSLYLACNDKKAFFTSSDHSRYTLWSCQNVCDALSYLLDNFYIRFWTKLYRQIVGIPMGTNCAPLVADLFLYCYERNFMDSLNHNNQADIIEAFNSTSRYLDDLLNIDNPYFQGMVNQIYPPELQLNKAHISDTEDPFLDLHLSVSNGLVSSKIYGKRDDLSYLLDNIYIRFGTKLYRQIVGIPMGTNCAPLVADLFLYCYERDFMDSFNHDNQADVIEAFNSTSRYLDDLLNIDNPYFEGMVNQIYPSELQLKKANISDTEAPFLDLHLSVANGFVSSKIYDKRDDFDFDIVNFPFCDGDVPRRASYGVYISQLIRFARVCNHGTDFNARNKCLTAKLLQQGYRYHKLHKLRKTFSKFYRRHYELISKYNVGLKTLLSEGLSEPEFYGDLVYKFKKLIGTYWENSYPFGLRYVFMV